MFFGRKRNKNSLALKALCIIGDATGVFGWTVICYEGKQHSPAPYLVNACSIYSSWLLPSGNLGQVAKSFISENLNSLFFLMWNLQIFVILSAKSSTGAPDCFSSFRFPTSNLYTLEIYIFVFQVVTLYGEVEILWWSH